MKKTLIVNFILLFTLFILTTKTVHAQVSMMGIGDRESQTTKNTEHGESIEVVLQEILVEQNVTTVQELDCSNLEESDLEQLGDAVMEQQHPGEAHEVMDQMMGGEGSESLKEIHINMGNSYLGCNGRTSFGMMSGGGMMGLSNSQQNNFYGRGSSMMGWNAGMFAIQSGLTWLAVISFLLSGVYFFLKQANKK
jgi:hypothetical protein